MGQTQGVVGGGQLSADRMREVLAEVGLGTAGQRPAHLLHGSFTVAETSVPASCLVTAHGIYELFVNGSRVGDRELTTGFTAYHKRLEVQTYNLGDLLRPGRNTIVVVLSDGWRSQY